MRSNQTHVTRRALRPYSLGVSLLALACGTTPFMTGCGSDAASGADFGAASSSLLEPENRTKPFQCENVNGAVSLIVSGNAGRGAAVQVFIGANGANFEVKYTGFVTPADVAADAAGTVACGVIPLASVKSVQVNQHQSTDFIGDQTLTIDWTKTAAGAAPFAAAAASATAPTIKIALGEDNQDKVVVATSDDAATAERVAVGSSSGKILLNYVLPPAAGSTAVDASPDIEITDVINELEVRLGKGNDSFTAVNAFGKAFNASSDARENWGLLDASVALGVGDALSDGALSELTVDGGDGNDTIVGSNGHDVINGGVGDDVLRGENGADEIDGSAGNDYLSEGASGANGGDELRGGAGDDVVLYVERTRDLLVTIGRSPTTPVIDPATGLPTSDLVAYDDDGEDGEGDTVLGDVERVYGGRGDDIIYGNELNNVLYGGYGDDILSGGAGNDSLDGGPLARPANAGEATDDDVLEGGDGNDIMTGGLDSDEFFPGSGKDEVYGDCPKTVTTCTISGDDWIEEETAYTAVSGVTSDDVFDGGPGLDTVSYRARIKGVSVNLNDTADDGEYTGTIAAGSIAAKENDNVKKTVERVFGSEGDDRLVGNSAGPDMLYGGGGNDFIRGGAGADVLDGGVGNDKVWGEGDGDTLSGGLGDDIVLGDAGDDTILEGDEISGQDVLSGGAGIDKVSYVDRKTAVKVVLRPAATAAPSYKFTDKAEFQKNGTNVTAPLSEGQAISGAILPPPEGSTTNASEGDVLTADLESIIGGDGNDELYGNLATNFLYGNGGNDKIWGDTVDGINPVVDPKTNRFPGAVDYIFGGDGNDEIRAGSGDDVVEGNDGDDTVYGDDGDDLIDGGAGFNRFDCGDGDGDISLLGTELVPSKVTCEL